MANKNFSTVDLSKQNTPDTWLGLTSMFCHVDKGDILMLLNHSSFDMPLSPTAPPLIKQMLPATIQNTLQRESNYTLEFFEFLYKEKVVWYFFKDLAGTEECVIDEIKMNS